VAAPTLLKARSSMLYLVTRSHIDLSYAHVRADTEEEALRLARFGIDQKGK
jgi:hypothetical protein